MNRGRMTGFGGALTAGVVAAVLCAAPGPAAGRETVPAGTLEEVLRGTLQTNEALLLAREDSVQAENRKKRFFMSLTPDLSLQAWGKRLGVEGVEDAPETDYGYALTLTQPIYTGGRALAAYRGAGNQEISSRIQEDVVRRDLLLAAAEAYFGVLASIETVRIGEQAVVAAERHLDLAQRRLDLGEGVMTDRLRAEVNLAERKSELIRFRNDLEDTRDLVRRMSGRTLSDEPRPAAALPAPPGDLEALVAEALAVRPVRRQDRLDILSAEEDLREKRGRFLPSFALSASYTGSGEEIGEQTTAWEAGLVLEIPIYQRASRFYLARESSSALRQARIREEGREKEITLEVSRLLNALKASAATIETLGKQVELARENFRLAGKRFGVGLADSVDIVDAQTALVQAQVGLAAESFRQEVAKLRLTRALGRPLFPGLEGSADEAAAEEE